MSTTDSVAPTDLIPANLADHTLIRLPQAAAMLGVCRRTLERWCDAGPDAGLAPVWYEIGRSRMFRPVDVAMFILERRAA